MGKINYLLLLLSSLWSLSLCLLRHRYVLVRSPKTWSDAQSYCRQNCLDLATVDDMGEMTAALTAVKDQYTDAVWTGLYKGPTPNWYWSLADDSFYKAGERNYLHWKSNDVRFNCGVFQDDLLYAVSCGDLYYSICFDGSQSGLQQYVLITQTMIWTKARDNCRTYYTDLVSVRNANESQMLQQVAGGLLVWTGLFRDPWVWSDQTYSSFRYWRPSVAVYTVITTQACVAMLYSESGKWADLSCGEVHPFLCSLPGPVSRFIKMRISSQDSGLDVNEPAVRDNMLQQFKQMLAHENMTDVIYVNWMKGPDGRLFTKEATFLEKPSSP